MSHLPTFLLAWSKCAAVFEGQCAVFAATTCGAKRKEIDQARERLEMTISTLSEGQRRGVREIAHAILKLVEDPDA